MGKVVSVTVGCLIGISMVPVPAAAHDHRPPRATLASAADQQRGRPLHSAWLARADSRFCDFMTRRALPSFPRALPHATGEEVRILLPKAAAPLELSVEAWRAVGSDGRPKGARETVPAALVPRLEGTQVAAWEIRFVPPPVTPHLYLAVEAYWADEESCSRPPDLGSQSASWAFHLAGTGR